MGPLIRQSTTSPLRPLLSYALCFAIGILAPPIGMAVPPAALAGAISPLEWREHRVIPGERLKEIAARHGVSVTDLKEWNALDARKPRLRIHQRLRIRTRFKAPNRERRTHKVRRGETWHRIARKYGVNRRHLQKRWNSKLAALHPGDKVTVWVDDLHEAQDPTPLTAPAPPAPGPEPGPSTAMFASTARRAVQWQLSPDANTPLNPYPIVEVSSRSKSVGRPGRGRIRHSVRLPANDALYRRRDASHSYASAHMIMILQRAIAAFRKDSGYGGEVVFNDLSRRRGGRLSPHNSHQSGRDADIRLLLVPGTERKNGTGTVDWDATWALMHSFIETGHVQYIFLSRSRQRLLRRAAVRAGVDPATLEKQLQYPGRARRATIRHAPGHDRHFHLRVDCGKNEKRCHD